MKSKLKENIMETKNWIEIIKEAVRVAMNERLNIQTGTNKDFVYSILINHKIHIFVFKEGISISTSNGYIHIDHSTTDREELEIRALTLSIKEYNEDIAISELENFISSTKIDHEIKDINDLDD